MFIEPNGVLWYSVEGINPEPWESPDASVGRRKGGGFFVQMHSSARMRNYQDSIREEFARQNPNAIDMHSVALSVQFYLWRDATGKNVDATNCQKALEDALQGILYSNDTNNAFVSTFLFQEKGIEPFILIRIEPWIDLDPSFSQMKNKLTSPKRTGSISTILSGDRGGIF